MSAFNNTIGSSKATNLSFTYSDKASKINSSTDGLSNILPFANSNHSNSIGGISGTAISSYDKKISASSEVSNINGGLFGTTDMEKSLTGDSPLGTINTASQLGDTESAKYCSHTKKSWNFLSNG